MTFIADLHIHSRYSRATSRDLSFEQLHAWGRRKGVALIGTGDCTHPGWLAEIREKLAPAGDGLFRLREAPAVEVSAAGWGEEVRFLLTGEISTIYTAGGATRKVHHLVCLPDLDAAEAFAARLERLGNIASDGRPILGMDSRDLLEVLLESSARAVLIPAHIWTPWFSVLGSKSGFDTVEACYRDLAGHIFAVETGLSSDPPMNWMVSHLDRYALVSNSDAHSPSKLGREANRFSGEMGYSAVMRALRGETPDFLGTLEFFPEEGKYHYDGHRKCNVLCAPAESKAHGGRCPVCGGPLTLGVEYRVTELADRPRGRMPDGARPFHRLLSLAAILGEVLETGASSKKVTRVYDKLVAEVGPELFILLEAKEEAISHAGGPLLARAVMKMRDGKVHATPGYDGEYGIITVFTEEERAEVLGQIQLFAGAPVARPAPRPAAPRAETPAPPPPVRLPVASEGLSAEQQRAVEHPPGPLLITAGPGAGKTRTLVERIARLVCDGQADPGAILALTFSNRAARELAERLAARLPSSSRPLTATFHKLGFRIIAEQAASLGLAGPPAILPEEEAEQLFAQCGAAEGIRTPEELERALAALFADADAAPDTLRDLAERARALAPAYAEAKRARGALDFTDLLILPLGLLAGREDPRRHYRQRWPHVFVDEYQDVNVFQYLLLRLLCPPGGHLCAIGDPDQAIYGFRGADVRYFLRFREDYPGAAEMALTRNYRSCRAIVEAGARVMAGHGLGGARMWSDLSGPERIEMATLPTGAAEAEYVIRTIEELLGGISHFSVDSGRGGDGVGHSLGFGDIAVLYRTHALGDEAQQAFARSGIPFQRAARKDLFHRADVRAVLAAVADAGDSPPSRALLQACQAAGITGDMLAHGPWPVLLRHAADAEDVPAFRRALNLERDIDIHDPRAARVSLMTVHAAKGLEWEVVFLLGCEEGGFPHPAAPEDEERRLFYVGMTRARRLLYLSQAAGRVLRGERVAREPSLFVRDIRADLLHATAPFAHRARPRDTQLALLDLPGK